MRTYLFILALGLISYTSCLVSPSKINPVSQNESLDSLWTSANEALQKDLPQDALRNLNKIIALSESQNAPDHKFKALLETYRIERRIEGGVTPVRNILNLKPYGAVDQAIASLYKAEALADYFLQNRWEIHQRTDIQDDTGTIETWSTRIFLNKIYSHIDSANNASLLNEPIEKWQMLLNSDVDSSLIEYRPSLYDVVAYKSVQLLQHNELRLDPELVDPSKETGLWFVDVDSFLQLDVESSQTARSLYHLFSKWLERSREADQSKVLAHADFERHHFYLSYLDAQIPFLQKKDIWNSFIDRYPHTLAADRAQLRLAQLFRQRQESKVGNLNGWTAAFNLCEALIESTEHKAIRQSAQEMKDQIQAQELSLSVEEVSLPGKKQLIYLYQRNVKSVTLSYYALKPDQLKSLNNLRHINYQDDLLQEIKAKANKLSDEVIQLPQKDDFAKRSFEIAGSSLNAGVYLLEVEADGNMAHAIFQVSKIGFAFLDEQMIVVGNREDGQPLKSSTIIYDYRSDYNNAPERGQIVTNEYGQAFFPDLKKRNRISIQSIRHGEEELLLGFNSFYNPSSYRRPQKASKREHLLTDRSIYRPGQILYLKGISYEENGQNEFRVRTNEAVKVQLIYQGDEISSQTLSTDNYGSFSTQFVLPVGLLNGKYLLKTPNGSFTFRIESYRRPQLKIEAHFDSTRALALGDSIEVFGMTHNYSDFPIQNAKVDYRVEEVPHYFFWRSYIPQNNQTRIVATGRTFSDLDGKFGFKFPTTEDNVSGKRYKCFISVTDSKGEIVTKNLSIEVTQRGWNIKSNFEEVLSSKDWPDARLDLENSFGEPVSKDFRIVFSEVAQPDSHKVQRYWQFPDSILMPEEKFDRLFPTYTYMDWSDDKKWPIKESLHDNKYKKAKLYLRDIVAAPLQDQRKYRIQVYDKEELVNQFQFEYRESQQNVSNNGPWSIVNLPDTLNFSQDNSIEFNFKQAADHFWLAEKWNSADISLHLKESKSTFTISAQKSNYNNMVLTAIGFANNRFYQWNIPIVIEREKRTIEMQWLSLPNRVQAGQEVNVTIQSDQPSGQYTMVVYDASLDDIYPHHWNRIHKYVPHLHLNVRTDLYSSIYLRPQFYGGRLPYQQGSAGLKYPTIESLMQHYPMLYRNNDDAIFMSADMAAVSAEPRELTKRRPAPTTEQESTIQEQEVRTRTQETLLFESSLTANEEGVIDYTFTAGEAITEYKVMVFGHDGKVYNGTLSGSFSTYKPFYIEPYFPRHLQQGDSLIVRASLKSEIQGLGMIKSHCTIIDPVSGEELDHLFISDQEVTSQINDGNSTIAQWKIQIPDNLEASNIKMCIRSTAQEFKDGICSTIPIHSNLERLLKTQPFYLSEGQKYELEIEDWEIPKDADLKLELIYNPYWYVIQSLPYISDGTSVQAHAVINRIFINSLSAKVVQEHPNLLELLKEEIRINEGSVSPLQTREELKYQTLEGTPWMGQAKRSSLHLQKAIQMLDPLIIKSNSLKEWKALASLQQMDGGISWSPGGKSNVHISMYVAELLMKLKSLGVAPEQKYETIQNRILTYLDGQLNQWWERRNPEMSSTIPEWVIRYYRLRSVQSLNRDAAIWKKLDRWIKSKMPNEFTIQTKLVLAQAYIAQNDHKLAAPIVESIKQNAFTNELGFSSWNFNQLRRTYQDPILFQAEALHLFKSWQDSTFAERLQSWLLSQKRTNKWDSDVQTVMAIHALLFQHKAYNAEVSVKLKGEKEWTEVNKNPWREEYILDKPLRSDVKVLIENQSSFAWGAFYSSFEANVEEAKAEDSDFVQVKREYYTRELVNDKKVLKPADIDSIPMGKTLVSRIVVTVEQSMDFVHIEIPKPATMEPTQQISGYIYKDGIGLYRSFEEDAIHLYIDHLPKGTFVLEQDVYTSFEGSVASGLIKLECLFDPAFKSNTEGKRINTYDR